MNPHVSVIVPIYNTEKYLKKCLCSIQAQTLAELEIICIDDGSTDASCAVVDALASSDQRVRLLRHDRNHGQGAARNTGIRAARADYIACVDSDDFIDPGMLAALHGAATADDFDVVASGLREVNDQGETLRTIIPTDRTIIVEGGHDDVFAITDPSLCNKLWKRSIFTDNDLYFDETTLYEDLGWTYPALLASRRIRILAQAHYNYLLRAGSTTHSMGWRNIAGHIATYERLRQALEASGAGPRHATSFRNMVRQTLKYHAGKALECGGETAETLRYLRCLLAVKNAYVQPAEAGLALRDAAAIIHAIEFDPPDPRDAMLHEQAESIERLTALVAKAAAESAVPVPADQGSRSVAAQEAAGNALQQASRPSLTRSIGRMLHAISPTFATKMRHHWFRLNGGKFDAFAGLVEQRAQASSAHLDRRIDSLTSLIEQRAQRQHEDFDLRMRSQHEDISHRMQTQGEDLAGRLSRLELLGNRLKQITARQGDGSAAFMLSDSLARLSGRRVASESRLAVVSVLPPLETGIANCSLRVFEASPIPVDVFAPCDGAGLYLATTRRLPAAGGPVSIFALEALSAALTMHDYVAVIWVLGNSDHHLPVIRLLRETRHLPQRSPNWVQLHDPFLFNLLRRHAEDVGSDVMSLLRTSAPNRMSGADWDALAPGDFSALLDHQALPVRALLGDVPLRGVIVHSAAGRDMLQKDGLLPSSPDMCVLFHPVFDAFTARDPGRLPRFRLGSFGVPGAAKRTELVVAAFRMLRQQHPDATLVLAGYHAAAYAKAEGLIGEAGIEIHDNPNTPRFLELMAGVDVAVQLRQHDTGESSGVVPQLLSRDIPTIVSAVGAFTEYGEAVTQLPSESTAEELFAVVADNLGAPMRHRDARRAYAAAHGPHAFCAALLDRLTRPDPAP